MKAQNLTISIPFKGCNKNCPYCVSKITGKPEVDYLFPATQLMHRNADKVLTLARMCQVSSVLLTGKGEPFLNREDILHFTKKFSEFPIEIQTNGIVLNRAREIEKQVWFEALYEAGMNVIAISIDMRDVIEFDYKKLFGQIHSYGMIGRASFNITNKVEMLDFKDFVNLCKTWGVDQMTLRRIDIPNNTEETEQSKWIRENADPKIYEKLKEQMKTVCETGGFLTRVLPYGAKVYDYKGISVSYSDYCIQDKNNAEDIRSLIFQEDGHLYTSWNSKASILF